MRRGTTQRLSFTFPESVKIESFYLTFSQKNKIILEKTLEDCEELEGNTYLVQLSQEDTLKFIAPRNFYMQLRVRDCFGNAAASTLLQGIAEPILKEGVV